MNNKEKKEILLRRLDALRFGHVDHSKDEVQVVGKFDPFKFSWGDLIKPPVTAYLSPKTIDDLNAISTDPKLMNNIGKKYKFLDQTLLPMRFRLLASGTNRRAYYCEYDNSIIMKIGSDRVGRSDNIAEYHVQQLIKPFCCKVFDVVPTGVAALIERVEPVDESSFKSDYANMIFDLIMSLLYRGYILEDVGGNYFKNWGIRFGFGIVLIDFPYIYNIDWGKIRCERLDPITKIRCNGDLDYDYSRGMSEIICTKCGIRYSARHLARAMSINDINNVIKGDVFSMSSLKNIRVELYRGDKVVYSSYNESDNAGRTMKNQSVRTESKPNPVPVVQQQTNTMEAVVAKTTSQPTVQQPINQQQQFNQRPVYQGRFEPIRDELMVDVTEWLDHIYKKYGKGAAIDLAKRLNVYYMEPEMRKGALLTQRNKFDNKSAIPNNRTESMSQQQHKETDSNDVVVNKEQVRPTENLFIVKPKTAKEIEAEEMAKRADKDEFLGIVGQPMVNKMKLESTVNNIKSRILTTFNYNIDQLTTDQDLEQFSETVRTLISDEIAKIAEITKSASLMVNVEKKLDTKNMICYALRIMHLSDVLIELDLYPKEEGDKNKRQIAEGIEVNITIDDEFKAYLDNKIAEYLSIKANIQQTEEEYKSYMIGSLIGDLQKDKGYEFGTANTIAYNYLTQCNWGIPSTEGIKTPSVEVEYDIANEL